MQRRVGKKESCCCRALSATEVSFQVICIYHLALALSHTISGNLRYTDIYAHVYIIDLNRVSCVDSGQLCRFG